MHRPPCSHSPPAGDIDRLLPVRGGGSNGGVWGNFIGPQPHSPRKAVVAAAGRGQRGAAEIHQQEAGRAGAQLEAARHSKSNLRQRARPVRQGQDLYRRELHPCQHRATLGTITQQSQNNHKTIHKTITKQIEKAIHSQIADIKEIQSYFFELREVVECLAFSICFVIVV